MSDIEARSRPAQRHTGFAVASAAGNNGDVETASTSYGGRVRTTTNGTIVRASDGDIEMGDDKKSVQPLPIPGSFDQRANQEISSKMNAAASTLSPSDISTPPDAPLLTTSASDRVKGTSGTDSRLLQSTLRSPRITSLASSHLSSGSGSGSMLSSHWSPGKGSDPRLYSASSQPYVYSSIKPYLSTSFQTSAERGRASGSDQKLDDRNDMDEDDDVFGNPSQALGLLSVGEPSPPQIRRSNEVEREDGDAAGVFSFSSPYFGPRSLEHSDIPPLSPSAESQQRSQRLMSPGWTAATLGKMSLNGSSPADNAASSSMIRRPFPSSQLGNAAQISQSFPTNSSGASALQAHHKKISYHRRPPAYNASKSYHLAGGSAGVASGSSMLHPHSPYHRSASSNRSRSRSRNRVAELSAPRAEMRRPIGDVVDDDETDEEAMVMDADAVGPEEDEDATEDEADPRINRFKAQTIRGGRQRYHDDVNPQGRTIGAAIPLHRHPSGQATTMSASYERANSGLNRQFISDRYANISASHYALGRHHPYALGSASASPSNAAGALSSHSPGNSRLAPSMGRRRSSFGSNNASPQQAPNMLHQLSHSPRYVHPRPAGSSVYEQGYPNPLSAHAYHPQQGVNYHYGESPDSAGGVRRGVYAPTSGLNRQRGQTNDDNDDEEEEEDEDEDDEEEEDEEEEEELIDEEGDVEERRNPREATVKKKPPSKQSRSTSASRANAVGNNSGEVESVEMNEVTAIRERLGGAANCSAFISKLWYLMCRPELYAKFIHWSESGDSVILSNDPDINNEFAAEVLPKLFKHGNNASFVRQLNLYGFQRVPSSRLLDAAETRAAKNMMSNVNISTALQLYGPHSSFAHPRFKRDQESLLPSMKPRSSKKTKKGGGQGGAGGGAAGGGQGAGSEAEDDYGM